MSMVLGFSIGVNIALTVVILLLVRSINRSYEYATAMTHRFPLSSPIGWAYSDMATVIALDGKAEPKDWSHLSDHVTSTVAIQLVRSTMNTDETHPFYVDCKVFVQTTTREEAEALLERLMQAAEDTVCGPDISDDHECENPWTCGGKTGLVSEMPT